MINKQGLWFLTLFSLILVLSVYYVTMPNEIFSTPSEELTKETSSTENELLEEVSKEITESNYITALKIELDEKREELTKSYEETINSKEATTEEKNSAYEAIKEITNIKGIEENLVEKISKTYSYDSFVKVENDNIQVVIENDKHDIELANNIMRLVQEEFEEAMSISVKFC